MKETSRGITLSDLLELARTSPEHGRLYMGLAAIDSTIQQFVKDIVESSVTSPDSWYIKTELQNQCYTVLLFNTDRMATIGHSWPLADFLELCSGKKLEMEMNVIIKKMIIRAKERGLSTKKTNWI